MLCPLLYRLYTSHVADILPCHNLNFHFYADDSQQVLSFKDADQLFDSKVQFKVCVKKRMN